MIVSLRQVSTICGFELKSLWLTLFSWAIRQSTGCRPPNRQSDILDIFPPLSELTRDQLVRITDICLLQDSMPRKVLVKKYSRDEVF